MARIGYTPGAYDLIHIGHLTRADILQDVA